MKTLTKLFAISVLLIMLGGCEFEPGSSDLTGSWTCTETSIIFKNDAGTSVYPVYIAQDMLDVNKYYIDNFYKLGSGVQVYIQVSGFSVNLPRQTVNGWEFEGSGSLSGDYNLIEIDYSADDGGGDVDQVEASYAR